MLERLKMPAAAAFLLPFFSQEPSTDAPYPQEQDSKISSTGKSTSGPVAEIELFLPMLEYNQRLGIMGITDDRSWVSLERLARSS